MGLDQALALVAADRPRRFLAQLAVARLLLPQLLLRQALRVVPLKHITVNAEVPFTYYYSFKELTNQFSFDLKAMAILDLRLALARTRVLQCLLRIIPRCASLAMVLILSCTHQVIITVPMISCATKVKGINSFILGFRYKGQRSCGNTRVPITFSGVQGAFNHHSPCYNFNHFLLGL